MNENVMASKYVVITIEEYKELLKLQIHAEYRDKIAELEEEIDFQKRMCTHWFNQYENECKKNEGGEAVA